MTTIRRIAHGGILEVREKAVCIDYRNAEIWVPRSVIEDPHRGEGLKEGDPAGTMAVLSRFAAKKGLG